MPRTFRDAQRVCRDSRATLVQINDRWVSIPSLTTCPGENQLLNIKYRAQNVCFTSTTTHKNTANKWLLTLTAYDTVGMQLWFSLVLHSCDMGINMCINTYWYQGMSRRTCPALWDRRQVCTGRMWPTSGPRAPTVSLTMATRTWPTLTGGIRDRQVSIENL